MSAAPEFPAESHNHRGCIEDALQRASALCRERGARFTPIRRRVLELVWASHRPVRAYDLLKQLREEKHNAEPPTVYRALDFLLDYGLVHRIESLNAYVGCGRPSQPHSSQFLICVDCRQVAELDDSNLETVIADKALEAGFEVTGQTVEIAGRCPACRE